MELSYIAQQNFIYFFLTTACFTISVPPKIYDISSDMTINEGTNVTLICLATGKPEPTISWRHISPSGKAELCQCCLCCSLFSFNLTCSKLESIYSLTSYSWGRQDAYFYTYSLYLNMLSLTKVKWTFPVRAWNRTRVSWFLVKVIFILVSWRIAHQ